ncbi:MAG: gliding motility-associated protein GldE [Chitinophagales bacterium]|nr:gliding motility-associated protein GldE [Chitinophagales bacterium]
MDSGQPPSYNFLYDVAVVSQLSITVVYFLLFIFTIYLSGMISSTEAAIFSLNNEKKKLLEKSDLASDLKILRFLRSPNEFVSTVALVNLLLFVCLIIWAIKIYESIGWNTENVLIKFSIITVLIVIIKISFTEMIPKSKALSNNLRHARKYVGIISFFNFILKPFILMLTFITNLINGKLDKYNKGILSVELNQAIDNIDEDDKTGDQIDEKDILKGIVQFGDISASQIMCSRMDVVYVDASTNFKDLLRTVRESGYSRIPVCVDNLDHTIGILYAKDLLKYLDKEQNFDWLSLIKPALFVPESKKIDTLLDEFRAKKIHLAIVVDEYGGASGLVTMEDILEEIIGEIKDEFDDLHEIDYRKIDETTFIFEGKTSINDVCKVMDTDFDTFDEEKGEADSIAGLILEIKGEMPKLNDEVTIAGYTFKVLEINLTRIVKVKITKNEI